MTDPRGHDYMPVAGDVEREALLPTHSKQEHDEELTLPSSSSSSRLTRRSFSLLHVAGAFAGGIAACILAQYAICGRGCIYDTSLSSEDVVGAAVAPPWVGSTTVHNFPPSSPTNTFPTLFPTDVGYPGGTPTGGEPAVIATAPAYPVHTGAAQLIVPESLGSHSKHKGFDLFKSWGNLSPWYSVGKKTFGVDAGPEVPDTCRVTGLHFLHRHGARYPTAWGRLRSSYELLSNV